MSIKTVLYARVSTRDQAEEGYSLPAQERLLEEYAKRNDLEIDRVFSVPESAAGRLERKTFKEMLEYLGANPNLKVILCEKVDRITRNFKDSVALDEWLNGDGERRVHFVKQGLVIHRDAKSNEKFQWDIHVVLARNYTNNLSEEVRKGQAEKIADGWLPGKPPLGYKNVETQGRMVQVLDPAVAPLVRRMFELYATGLYSTKLLGDIMYEEGLRTRNGCRLVKSRLHSLLQDPYYYGMIRWNGKIHQGKHEPLISRELFRTVQDVLDGKNNPKHRKYLPLFKVLVRCGDCGGTITWQIQKNHWYGRCNRLRGCGQRKYTRQERLEEKIHECLDGLTAGNSRVIEWIRKTLKESHRDETEYNRSCLEELNRRYETLQRREEPSTTTRWMGR